METRQQSEPVQAALPGARVRNLTMTLPRPATASLLGGLLLGGLALTAQAEDTFSPDQLAVMAGGCASCHGTDGRLARSEEHTSELQSRPHLVCRLLLEKKKNRTWP